jgi:chemotaxis protein MotB
VAKSLPGDPGSLPVANHESDVEEQADNRETPQPIQVSTLPVFSIQDTEPSKEQGDGWVISFLDMMILVLTFFVAFIATQMPTPKFLGDESASANTEVLETISQASGKKSGSNESNLITPIPTLPPSADEAAENRRVDINQSNDGVTLTIDDRFVFPSGSANISAEGARTIERLVPLLQDLQGKIEVFGHTDNIPIRTDQFETNWELSAARAVNIVRLLISQGIDEDRLRAVGVAHTQPIATNATELGRSQNRRVEIQVRKQ